MASNNIFASFDTFFRDRPFSSAGPRSRLMPEGFVISHIPDKAERSEIAVDLLNLETYRYGPAGPQTPKIEAMMRAMMPLVMDLRTALLSLDMNSKSEGDRQAIRLEKYFLTWLYERCKRTVEILTNCPLGKMDQVAASHLPISPESFRAALNESPYALQLMLHKFPEKVTQELCDYAVEQHPGAIACVPGQFRTREMCMKAASAETFAVKGSYVLLHIPEVHRTDDIIRAALASQGMNLQHVTYSPT